MSGEDFRRTLAGILHSARTADQARRLLDGFRGQVLAEEGAEAALLARADRMDQLDADIGYPVRRPTGPVTMTADQYRAAAAFLADTRQPAPAPPATPLLAREQADRARPRCTERTTIDGTPVTCLKQRGHPGPWHRGATRSWKVVVGGADPHRIVNGRAANELGGLRILAHDWRTTLRTIAQLPGTCCTAASLARDALHNLDHQPQENHQ